MTDTTIDPSESERRRFWLWLLAAILALALLLGVLKQAAHRPVLPASLGGLSAPRGELWAGGNDRHAEVPGATKRAIPRR